MKFHPSVRESFRLCAGLAVVCPLAVVAQGGNLNSAPALNLTPVVVVSMPTEAGKLYQMEASGDLQKWEVVGQPVFGDGEPITQPRASAGQEFFRLKILDQAEVDPALWSPLGIKLQFNDGSRTVLCSFGEEQRGTWRSGIVTRSFAWTWCRSATDGAKATLEFSGSSRETLALTFAGARSGQFTRQTWQGGALTHTEDGSFGPETVVTGSLVPSSILGRTLALCDKPGLGSLKFSAAGYGTRVLEGEAAPFSGSWLVSGTTSARLIANFDSTHGEDYRFTFTGPGTGRFTRQTFTEGVFRDEDSGTFCLGLAP